MIDMDQHHHHAADDSTAAVDPQLARRVYNPPHQHAFSLVGMEHVFAVHMTQYHHEVHKYQLIFKLKLPDWALEAYRDVRRNHPADFIVLCNDASDEFIIPAIPSAEKPAFKGNIFLGMPQFPPEMLEDPHFFPWDPTLVDPIAGNLVAEVERVVLYRMFAHHYQQPRHATYYLFGQDGEAHMNSLQTASLASSPFEADAFGPDYDHVLSLSAAPDWLDNTLLKAGVVVTTPSVVLRDDNGQPCIPCQSPFADGEMVDVLYRGIGPTRQVQVGHTTLCATGVSNSENIMPCAEDAAMGMSTTPIRYMKDRR